MCTHKGPYAHTHTNTHTYTHTHTHTHTHIHTYTHTHTHTHIGGEREGAKKSSSCVWHALWLCVVCQKCEEEKDSNREPQTYIHRKGEVFGVCVCLKKN